jgi:gas vesicle protein
MQARDFSKQRLLEALGLEEKPSAFSVLMGALGTFALGALVGAGVGLLSAPKPGRELRSKLRKQLGRYQDELEQRIS